MAVEEFDHPCKETCSGWEQGRQRGLREAAEQYKEMSRIWLEQCERADAEVGRLKAELVRSQEDNRAREKILLGNRDEIARLKSALDSALKDLADQKQMYEAREAHMQREWHRERSALRQEIERLKEEK